MNERKCLEDKNAFVVLYPLCSLFNHYNALTGLKIDEEEKPRSPCFLLEQPNLFLPTQFFHSPRLLCHQPWQQNLFGKNTF